MVNMHCEYSEQQLCVCSCCKSLRGWSGSLEHVLDAFLCLYSGLTLDREHLS